MDTTAAGGPSARERILDTAYDLFSRHGTHAVGVDAIVAGSGVAKMSLYRNFGSKDELILEFLRMRERVWGRDFLIAEVEARADAPAERLLAIFDVLGEWYARNDFEGCSFTKLVFTIDDRDHPVRRAAVQHMDNVRAEPFGREAGARRRHLLRRTRRDQGKDDCKAEDTHGRASSAPTTNKSSRPGLARAALVWPLCS